MFPKNIQTIAFHTSTWEAFFTNSPHAPHIQEIIKRAIIGECTLITSLQSPLYILSQPQLTTLQVQHYTRLFYHSGIIIHESQKEETDTILQLTKTYGIPIADAVELSAAIQRTADLFITADKTLKKVLEIRIMQIEELETKR